MKRLIIQMSTLDRILFVLLILVLIVLSSETISALFARPCSLGVYDGCYPWGAEGPAAESWFYKTKVRYLVQGTIINLFLLLMILFLVRLPLGAKKTVGVIGAVVLFLAIWSGLDLLLLRFYL